MKNTSKRLKIIIALLVTINAVTLYFLFTPHHPPFGKRPPSLTKMLDIEGEAAKKIIQLENHHFGLKTRLIDENAIIRRKIFNQLEKGAKLKDTDSLFAVLLKNEKEIEVETITFFVKLRKLIPAEKRSEVDDIIQHVLSGRQGPPPRK